MLSKENMAVLTNIIGAVESGGQVYGKRNYAAYAPPYKNSAQEHTVTLGWAQNYGSKAHTLIERIHNADPAKFRDIDTQGVVEKALQRDWVATKWNPSAKEKDILIKLIDSAVGHKIQDEMFAEDMEVFVKSCEDTYTKEVPAIMMYCEIRHLGGAGPVKRVFGRLGDFSLTAIMASLAMDQTDTSSENQVGDKKFWTRHEKCKEFIEKYAVLNKEEIMAVTIGSARGDEYREAAGGRAGDQLQKKTPDFAGEVSRENWYLHSKGWYVVRAKDAAIREKIAKNMEYACDNPHIGYDQSQNQTLYQASKQYGYDCSKVTVNCETDCARLVRVCVLYSGVDAPDFYTASLASALKSTGAFEVITDSKYCNSSDYLVRGDILVTRTKGHTVVVLNNGAKVETKPENSPGENSQKSNQDPTVEEIAKRVIAGQFGNGDVRKRLIEAAGYNYEEVRAKVNEILKGEAPKSEYPKHGTVTADKLNVRTGPDKSKPIYKPYPLLLKGNEVDVLGKSGEWLNVRIAGKHLAFIHSNYVKVD